MDLRRNNVIISKIFLIGICFLIGSFLYFMCGVIKVLYCDFVVVMIIWVN